MDYPTQDDVAALAGVSRSTVAAVLNEKTRSRFKEETQNAVLGAAAKLGYRPNRFAQAVRKGRQRVIGIVYFGRFLRMSMRGALAMAAEIHRRGFGTFDIHPLGNSQSVDDAVDRVLAERVRGTILLDPGNLLSAGALRELVASRMPVVALRGMSLPGVPQVRSDTCRDYAALTRHVIEQGRRHLVLIVRPERNDPRELWPMLDRASGFRRGITEAGGEVREAGDLAQRTMRRVKSVGTGLLGEIAMIPADGPVDEGYEWGYQAMRQVLAWGDRPDAALMVNDACAMGALAACHEQGVRVPDDMVLTGYDNDPASSYTIPALTTVQQPTETMAKKAVDLLLSQMDGSELAPGEELTLLPGRPIFRASSTVRIE